MKYISCIRGRECKEIGIKKIYTIDEFGKFE